MAFVSSCISFFYLLIFVGASISVMIYNASVANKISNGFGGRNDNTINRNKMCAKMF